MDDLPSISQLTFFQEFSDTLFALCMLKFGLIQQKKLIQGRIFQVFSLWLFLSQLNFPLNKLYFFKADKGSLFQYSLKDSIDSIDLISSRPLFRRRVNSQSLQRFHFVNVWSLQLMIAFHSQWFFSVLRSCFGCDYIFEKEIKWIYLPVIFIQTSDSLIGFLPDHDLLINKKKSQSLSYFS